MTGLNSGKLQSQLSLREIAGRYRHSELKFYLLDKQISGLQSDL